MQEPKRGARGKRADELLAKGVPPERARGIALLEERIARWPAEWGDNIMVLLHGDFGAPAETMLFETLGIEVEAGEVRDSILKAARTVVQARVGVKARTVAGLIDAANRISILLSVYSASVAGAASAGWWCHLTHGTPQDDHAPLVGERIVPMLESLHALPQPVARRVRTALAWIAEPRPAAAELYRLDLTHRFVAYWNAFEALVDAICMIKPVVKPQRPEQVDQLRHFLAERGAGIGLGDIDEAYWRFVETGFVGRATYALGICFGAQAPAIIEHCFHRLPERERLLNFRNALCRGNVDAEILKERVRIESKQARLSFIVFGMLARLVPVPPRQ